MRKDCTIKPWDQTPRSEAATLSAPMVKGSDSSTPPGSARLQDMPGSDTVNAAAAGPQISTTSLGAGTPLGSQLADMDHRPSVAA